VAGVGGEAEVDAAVGGGVHRVRKQSMKEKSVGVSGAGGHARGHRVCLTYDGPNLAVVV
jgi:hypothetical protein